MEYKLIDTIDKLDILEAILLQEGRMVFDIETTSLYTHSEDIKIVGFGFCCSTREAYYVPVTDDNLSRLIALCSNKDIQKIGHNIKFDARVINRFGGNVTNIIFDTLVAHYCLYSDLAKHNLDDIVLEYFNHVKIRTKDIIPRKSKTNLNPNMGQAPIEKVGVYCCEDAYYTYQLYLALIEDLKNNTAASELYYNIELPLISVLIDMECSGVAIDKAAIINIKNKLELDLKQKSEEIDLAAGRHVTLTNPNDIAKVLFEELQIQMPPSIVVYEGDPEPAVIQAKQVPKTAKGKYKTDKATLDLFSDVPIVKNISDVKKLNKLLTTYISSFPEYISGVTGRLHAFFNQSVTSTGRLSSSNPNLQNQPARDQLGKEIRSVYVSRWPEGQILAADYSQAELRILAHMANEPVLIENFLRGGDAHLAVASKIYNRPESQISNTERTFTKTINFGMIYGMGAKKLALTLGISVPEADDLIKRYLGSMKGVKSFIQQSERELVANGFTETFFGRRRYIPKVYSKDRLEEWAAFREGCNHKVQGTNADIIKLAMVKINNRLKFDGFKSLLILQIHDELVFDVHPDELFIKDMIKEAMETIVNFSVPMVAEPKYGRNWADSH